MKRCALLEIFNAFKMLAQRLGDESTRNWHLKLSVV
jgi:hypothetical protein